MLTMHLHTIIPLIEQLLGGLKVKVASKIPTNQWRLNLLYLVILEIIS